MKKFLPLFLLVAIVVPWQVAHAMPNQAGTPTVTLSTPVVPPGGSLKIGGTNFPAGTNCDITLNLQPTSQTLHTTTGVDGSFSTSLMIPVGTQTGSYSVIATCSGAASQPVTLQVATPQVTFNPSSVAPGNPVVISGSGFAGNAALTISVTINVAGGGTSPFSQTIQTATDGTFSGVTINVTSTAVNGSYPVQFSQSGSTVVTANLNVGQATTLTLAPSTISTGAYTTFLVSGTNFLVGEGVDVSYTVKQTNGGTQVISGVGTADSTGSINRVLLYVPTDAVPGTYTVTATGQNSHRVATSQLTVTPAATLSVAPASVPAGAIVTVFGQRFPSGASVALMAQITQKDGSIATQNATASADGSGNFSVPFTIPPGSASGSVHIIASAPGPANTQLTASADLNVTRVQPSLQLTPSVAAPGNVVAATASGFLPGAAVTVSSQVTANGAQQTLSQTVPADSAGVAQAFLTLPQGVASGTTTVTATQPAAAASASATLTIQAPPPVVTATPTSSPTPAPTATSLPTATPTAIPHVGFAYVRTRYHLRRAGQTNQVDAQANLAESLTIWVHIIYPTGRHIDYNSKTDRNGHWTRQFQVLSGSTNHFARRVYVHYQLWKGTQTAKTFGSFLIKG
ncbi:MAG: hypothetical protein NVS4B2_08100 [Chloroflexota bacterium]